MGRIVAITGGAGGLGLVAANLFLDAGDQVVVLDADAEAVASLAREGRQGLIPVALDMGDADRVGASFDFVLETHGGVDVLVNNVGIAGPRGPVETIAVADWNQTIAVNLTGAFVACQKVLPGMKSRGAGAIVNVSTSSVKAALPNRSAYVVSKAALEGLTAVIAREAGPSGVTCNIVRPGMMDNERMNRVLRNISNDTGRPVAELEAEALQFISMRSRVSMREVADMIVYLASPQARHVTGQTIAVDAGFEWEA